LLEDTCLLLVLMRRICTFCG